MTNNFSQPVISEEIIETYKYDIKEFIEEQRIGPELQLQEFDDLMSLVNDVDHENVTTFLNADPPHSFADYAQLIEKYDSLKKNIPVNYDRTFFSGLFDVHRKDLMDSVASIASYLREELVDRVILDYQNKSKK